MTEGGNTADSAAITGTTRPRSMVASSGGAPVVDGRVDSPPMSSISAPSATICCARATAAATTASLATPSAARPSCEKESGVMLRIPMTQVFVPQASVWRPQVVGASESGASESGIVVQALLYIVNRHL